MTMHWLHILQSSLNFDVVDWGGLIMLENHFKSVLFLFEKKNKLKGKHKGKLIKLILIQHVRLLSNVMKYFYARIKWDILFQPK